MAKKSKKETSAVPATPAPSTAAPSAGAAKKRRFEFVEGSSDKFWEIETAGLDVTVRFGRRGTEGQTKTKSFPDAAAAKKHADKLIEEKTGKGYVEVGA